MKKPVHRKKKEQPVIAKEILQSARTYLRSDLAQAPITGKCAVCDADVAQFSVERLCWVCRRLKISAWADRDNSAMMMGEQE